MGNLFKILDVFLILLVDVFSELIWIGVFSFRIFKVIVVFCFRRVCFLFLIIINLILFNIFFLIEIFVVNVLVICSGWLLLYEYSFLEVLFDIYLILWVFKYFYIL